MTAIWRAAAFAEADRTRSSAAAIGLGLHRRRRRRFRARRTCPRRRPHQDRRRLRRLRLQLGRRAHRRARHAAIRGGRASTTRSIAPSTPASPCSGPVSPLAEIYRATARRMWDLGFETYGRGHFGHGVGSSIWSEEWPFISATSDAVARARHGDGVRDALVHRRPRRLHHRGSGADHRDRLRGHGAAAPRPRSGSAERRADPPNRIERRHGPGRIDEVGQLESFTTTICCSKSM